MWIHPAGISTRPARYKVFIPMSSQFPAKGRTQRKWLEQIKEKHREHLLAGIQRTLSIDSYEVI
jgi:hypothetical protein